jgi:hypothetical protein
MLKSGIDQCLVGMKALHDADTGIVGLNGKPIEYAGAEFDLDRKRRYGKVLATPSVLSNKGIMTMGDRKISHAYLDKDEIKVGEIVYVSWGCADKEFQINDCQVHLDLGDMRFAVTDKGLEGLAGSLVVVPVFYRKIKHGNINLKAVRNRDGLVTEYHGSVIKYPFARVVSQYQQLIVNKKAPVRYGVARIIALPRSPVKGHNYDLKVGDIVLVNYFEFNHKITLSEEHYRKVAKIHDLWPYPYKEVRVCSTWNVLAVLDPKDFIVGPSDKS